MLITVTDQARAASGIGTHSDRLQSRVLQCHEFRGDNENERENPMAPSSTLTRVEPAAEYDEVDRRLMQTFPASDAITRY